jgi:hypothetical protein
VVDPEWLVMGADGTLLGPEGTSTPAGWLTPTGVGGPHEARDVGGHHTVRLTESALDGFGGYAVDEMTGPSVL